MSASNFNRSAIDSHASHFAMLSLLGMVEKVIFESRDGSCSREQNLTMPIRIEEFSETIVDRRTSLTRKHVENANDTAATAAIQSAQSFLEDYADGCDEPK